MAELLKHPTGLLGIEFVEFASLVPDVLAPLFAALGFARVAVHRSKDVTLYRQGDINLIVNGEPDSFAGHFVGCQPFTCGLGIRVKDAQVAYARAQDLGAATMECQAPPLSLRVPALQAIGGAPLYLVDRPGSVDAFYEASFAFIDGAERRPAGLGLTVIDHLVHDVYGGRLSYWAEF